MCFCWTPVKSQTLPSFKWGTENSFNRWAENVRLLRTSERPNKGSFTFSLRLIHSREWLQTNSSTLPQKVLIHKNSPVPGGNSISPNYSHKRHNRGSALSRHSYPTRPSLCNVNIATQHDPGFVIFWSFITGMSWCHTRHRPVCEQ